MEQISGLVVHLHPLPVSKIRSSVTLGFEPLILTDALAIDTLEDKRISDNATFLWN